uniref:Uncharacterized protein n=1 Tax=Sphaerodactylus townsendi TaxID=933632 RepID=A0ACB8F3E2_9SAUR
MFKWDLMLLDPFFLLHTHTFPFKGAVFICCSLYVLHIILCLALSQMKCVYIFYDLFLWTVQYNSVRYIIPNSISSSHYALLYRCIFQEYNKVKPHCIRSKGLGVALPFMDQIFSTIPHPPQPPEKWLLGARDL